jgi:two-component system, LytTR family, response regulator
MTQEKIHTILIDDEHRNNVLLKGLLEVNAPRVNVLGHFTEADAALEAMRQLRPQLVFLDVEMPGMNGFELLKQLEPLSFEVIFVTAYSQYAIDAFDCNAAGYITKPVNTAKLISTVQVAVERITQKHFNLHLFSMLENTLQQNREQKIPLATLNGMVFVKIDDILYCESSGNYTQFFMADKTTILVSRQLGDYEKLLPATDFMRIHDKHIINLQYIKEYRKGSGGEVVLENGATLAVAARRKDEFLSLFDKWLKRK